MFYSKRLIQLLIVTATFACLTGTIPATAAEPLEETLMAPDDQALNGITVVFFNSEENTADVNNSSTSFLVLIPANFDAKGAYVLTLGVKPPKEQPAITKGLYEPLEAIPIARYDVVATGGKKI